MTGVCLGGAAIVTPEGIIEGASLRIADGRIVAVTTEISPTEDLGGGYLVPGFIDIQVNGGGGSLFNDAPDVTTIRTIAAAHRRFGTTALLPTLISDSPEKIAAAIDAVDRAIAERVPGVIGLHLEGPYLNPARNGIHDVAKIAPLSDDAITLLTRPGRGTRLVTLAPETAPAGAIARLRAAGVVVCAGHSMASYEQTRAALDEGLDGFTHLFNAMTPLTSREPGMVGAALDDRGSRFSLIPDGHHVHPAVMRVALAARGSDGVMMVTDAMPPVGVEMERFRLGTTEIKVAEGVLRGPDGTLAGSGLDMATAFRNAVTMIGLDILQAAAVTSTNAAAFLGIGHERGAIAAGHRADLVHVDNDLNLRGVWIDGQRTHG